MRRWWKRALPVLWVTLFNTGITLLTVLYLLGDGSFEGRREKHPRGNAVVYRRGR